MKIDAKTGKNLWIITGVCAALLAVTELYSFIRFLVMGGSPIFFYYISQLTFIAGMVCLAVWAFMGGKRILGIIGAGLCMLDPLYGVISNLTYWGDFTVYYLSSNIFRLCAVGMTLAAMIIVNGDSLRRGGAAAALRKLWFVPAVLFAVRIVIHIILAFAVKRDYGYFNYRFFNAFYDLLMIAVLVLANLLHSAFPDGLAGTGSGYGTYGSAQSNYGSGYGSFNLIGHVLLLLFTFGIWHFIWIYRVTEYTNFTSRAERRNPVTKLLLCMFVPFYFIYWIYRSCQRIDLMCEENRLPSETAVFCTVMMFLVPFVPLVLIQMKINDINSARVLSGAGSYGYQQNQYQNQQYQNQQYQNQQYQNQQYQNQQYRNPQYQNQQYQNQQQNSQQVRDYYGQRPGQDQPNQGNNRPY